MRWMGKLSYMLFPQEPRSFPYRRTVRTVVRAAHILTASVLMGGYVFAVSDDQLQTWWFWTIGTGFALLLTDLHASCAFLCEVRGAALLIKLLLVALMPLAGAAAPAMLAVALVIGAISSHMPGRYRHRLLFLRGVIVADRRHG